MRASIVAIVITLSGIARADGYVGFAPTAAGLSDLGVVGFAGVELGWQRRDVVVRGQLAAGVPVGDITGGSAQQLRAGVEYRPADCGPGCIYTGIDVGFARGQTRDWPDEIDVAGVVAIPRVGLDVGNAVRFRLGLELYVGVARVRDIEPDLVIPVDMTATKWLSGFALTTGLGVAF